MRDLWIVLGLAALAAITTWAARTLAARLDPSAAPRRPLPSVGAALSWVAILLVAGWIAARYMERVSCPALGWGAFALAAFLLSLAHALLHRRVQAARHRQEPVRKRIMHSALFVCATLLVLALAAFPIVASDLFRKPYSPVWRTINRVLDRLSYSYNPPGGGEPPSFPPWRNPGDAGLAYSDVTLSTDDGLHLAAWYVPASVPGARTVLLAHGLQDSKWTLLRLIPWLHDAGYDVLALDFRGHGQSDRRPATIGPAEAIDIRAALDWLQAEGVGDTVVGLGQSLGAAALLNAAVQDERLDALILDSLFAEWKNVDYARTYHLPPEWLVPGVPNPADLIRSVHVPVLVIHGTADNLVHADHALRLYLAANEPKELWINDSGHAWSAWTYPEMFREKVLGFLESAPGGAGKEKGRHRAASPLSDEPRWFLRLAEGPPQPRDLAITSVQTRSRQSLTTLQVHLA